MLASDTLPDLELARSLRLFDRARDGATVEAWFRCHGQAAPDWSIMPPVGVVATYGGEDGTAEAAGWLYQSAHGVGIIEHLVTAPGLSMAGARQALTAVVGMLERIAVEEGCGVLCAFALPGIARVAAGLGWRKAAETIMLVKGGRN